MARFVLHSIAAFFLLFVLSGNGKVAAQSNASFVFEGTEWDFGRIREADGPVSHTFRFVNGGKKPILIDRVTTSCGCTTPSYSRAPIMPGAEGTIEVTFDPTGRPDSFRKEIYVISEKGRCRDLLVIRGEVIPRPRTVEDDYPYYMVSGIRFDETTFAFRTLPQGGTRSMVVRYVNTSDRELPLAFSFTEQSGLLRIDAPESVCAGCRGEITLTYSLPEGEDHYGLFHDNVILSAGGKESERSLYTSAIGVDDFARQSNEIAPRLSIEGQYHDFGSIRRREEPYTCRVTFENRGEEPLIVRYAETKPELKSDIEEGLRLEPGESRVFEVSFDTSDRMLGDYLGTLSVIVNDPLRPMRTIRIVARIRD